MISSFFAKQPKRAWPESLGSARTSVSRWLSGMTLMLTQPLIPYAPRPQEPRPLPVTSRQPSDEQLALCKMIFDESDARRTHIEQKAQWAFTVIAFLIPSLASVFVFLVRDSGSASGHSAFAIVPLALSAILLFLSFVSATRALAIRGRETLHIGALVDDGTGYFLPYDKASHAQGLLYCATINTATNDHIAQFVKGAHTITAGAVVIFAFGVSAAALNVSGASPKPIRAEVVGPIAVSPASLSQIESDLQAALAAAAKSSSDKDVADRLQRLDQRVGAMEGKVPAVVDTPPKPTIPNPPKRRPHAKTAKKAS